MNTSNSDQTESTIQSPANSKLTAFLAGSLFLSLFYRLSCFIYRKAKSGLFGSIFTRYDDENSLSAHSFFCSLIQKMNLQTRLMRPARFFFARLFDQSLLIGFCAACFRRLIEIPLYFYGIFAISFSAGDFAVMGVSVLRFGFESVTVITLVIGLIALLAGIALLGSRKATGFYLRQGRLSHLICFDILGADETDFAKEVPISVSPIPSFFFGLTAGLITYFVPIYFVVLLLVGIIGLYTVLVIPEVGVLTTVFLMPFAPTMLLAAMVAYTALCYFLKLISGRRMMRFEPLDYAILVFALLYFFGCLTSINPIVSFPPTLVFLCFILGYFLVVNLIRDNAWFQRICGAIIFSASLEALYGIYQYYFGGADTTWQDTQMFDDISGRVVSTLENPNVLAEYLIICLPILFSLVWIAKLPEKKLSLAVPVMICGACLIFTWSRGAWLGFMFAFVILLLMLSRKSLVLCFFGLIAVPFSPLFLPESILHRFTSIGNLADSSTSYRVNIWEGAIRLIKDHFFSGIGSGIDLFPLIYPKYSLGGIEAAPHSHNLYLQLLVEMGIWGLLAFVLILVLVSKIAIKDVSTNQSDTNRLVTAGIYAGLLAVLIQGMTDYIWYNYRLFLFFWLMVGLLAARARITNNNSPYQYFERTKNHG